MRKIRDKNGLNKICDKCFYVWPKEDFEKVGKKILCPDCMKERIAKKYAKLK